MITNKPKQLGFTIVELLIVIIVIAILATLVITAYNGVQDKANNTKTITVVGEYIKAIKLYASENGDYPRGAGGATVNACFGIGYPGGDCANMTSTLVEGVGTAHESTYFNDELKPYFNGSLPNPNLGAVSWAGTEFRGAAIWYASNSFVPTIHYYLDGNVSCGNPGISVSSVNHDGGGTRCVVQPPAYNG